MVCSIWASSFPYSLHQRGSSVRYHISCQSSIFHWQHSASRVDRFYELWSPNANYHEFYPGSPLDNDHIIAASHQSDFAFPDGRLGPYDWSLHPQHFSLSAPWLGFCRRPPTGVSHWKDVLPELVPCLLFFCIQIHIRGRENWILSLRDGSLIEHSFSAPPSVSTITLCATALSRGTKCISNMY